MRRLLHFLGKEQILVGVGRDSLLVGTNPFPDEWRKTCSPFLEDWIVKEESVDAVELLRQVLESFLRKMWFLLN